MTFVLAWAVFPLVLALVGTGWGFLVEELSGARLSSGALLVPLGLAAAIVTAGILTTNGVTARLAAGAVGVVALIGLVRARRLVARWPRPGWPALAALGALLAYGAPVLATGSATWTGFIKLDDTSTWLAITAQMFAHGRSTAGLAPSVNQIVLAANLTAGAYPIGAFMLLGVGRALARVDAAWAFQPYIACAGAALSLCLYALCEPLVGSRRTRALVAFVAAQPALLYGYGLWGGIKEMTAAFLVALVVALGVGAMRRPAKLRGLLPLAVATAGLIDTLGPGTAVWVMPALGVVVVAWLIARRGGRGGWRPVATSTGSLAAATVVLSLPVWIVLAQSLQADSGFVGGAASKLKSVQLGNLRGPLSPFELAGIWPLEDFRTALGVTGETIVLIGLVLVAGLGAVLASIRLRRQVGVGLYLLVALGGCLAIAGVGGVPWVIGKSFAIASPAVLFAGVVGGAMLWGRRRVPGAIVLIVIAGGVLWSNALQYRGASFAPAERMAELARIGQLVDGRGPTFVNDYEVFADRYFLRNAAAVEPGEYRPVGLALRTNVLLDKPSWADLDSFGLQTLLPYRAIVTPRSPDESRPSSLYHLVWEGSYYQLWERPEHSTAHVLAHIPFGDSNQDPYCGVAVNGKTGAGLPLAPLCPVEPVAPAPCSQVRLIARYAAGHHAEIVADERQPSVYVAADQSIFPPDWLVSPESHLLAATDPGTATVQLSVTIPGRYMLWIGGDFGLGFDVTLDGRGVGRVHNELAAMNGYVPLTALQLTSGLHTITLTYPGRDALAPGSGDALGTTLSGVALEPLAAESGRLVTVDPSSAARLCGQSVDWLEVVAPQA